MTPKRRIPVLVLGSAVLAATAFTGIGAVAAAEMDDSATYRVTITNLASGQPLTPPLVVLHDAKTSIVKPGAPAGDGLRQLAENGDPTVLVDALSSTKGVAAVVVGDHPVVSGGIPGAAEVPSFAAIEVSGAGDRISVASMLICTNDGLSIAHDQKLPRNVGASAVFYSSAYDAGTEVNTESFADLVPPCQGLVGVTSDAEGTAASNPELAEGGVVAMHPGIGGAADLEATVHAVAANPALIVVERIS